MRRLLVLALVCALPTLAAAQYVPRAIQESDGTPKVNDATKVEIDQTTGLQLEKLSGTAGKIKLGTTAVSPGGSYGTQGAYPTFTVDAQGRLTAAGSVTLTHQFGAAIDTFSALDLPAVTDRSVIVNRAHNAHVTKVCCYADVAAVTISGRKVPGGGGPTPAPTPALPTPASCATPGALTADAGCITGLSFALPLNAEVRLSVPAVTGNKGIRVVMPYTTDDN